MQETSEIVYQASTMDRNILDVLYEGKSLQSASDIALAYEGASSIFHFRHDGTVRRVADYVHGQTVRGYVY